MAYLFQRPEAKATLGDKAPWYVAWRDPSGRVRKKKIGPKLQAKAFAAKVETDLARQTYTDVSRCDWATFRREYEKRELVTKKPGTRDTYRYALNNFERIAKPKDVSSIDTRMIDAYRAARLKEPGAKRGTTVSEATVNSELRSIQAAMAKAADWKYISSMPKVKMLREKVRIKRTVTAEHFEAIYEACDVATSPANLPYPTATWWRAFLMFAFTTGWRVGEILRVTWDEIDLQKGSAITRADDNKGGRDEMIPLHAVAVTHLELIRSFRREVFPWGLSQRALYVPFQRIQAAAGIHVPCPQKHEHTEACHLYGFHDLRRGFASVVAQQVGAKVLQSLMRHKDYSTTRRYIDMRDALQGVTDSYNIPVLRDAKERKKGLPG